MAISITTLVENTARTRGLVAEHGLAYWIETPTHRLLLDTGQGVALAHNAEALGLDIARLNAIVLSHGHFDHTGGLIGLLSQAPEALIHLHGDAFGRRNSGRTGRAKEIGMPAVVQQMLHQNEARVIRRSEHSQIIPGVFCTGQIPRLSDFEDTGGPFFLDEARTRPDPILDDQAIFFETSRGIVVVLGCAHAGVVNTLQYIQHLTGKPIYAIIGGTHLVNASQRRLERTIAVLRAMEIGLLVPAHCTGPRAMAALWTAFPDCVADGSAGTRWSFPTGGAS